MKCKYCGTNLGLQDEKCPSCGKLNELATKYVEEIREQEADLQRATEGAKEGIEIGARTGRLIVIIAMVLLVAVMQIVIRNKSDFDIREKHNSDKIDRLVKKYESDINTNIQEMEKNRDYLALSYYFLNYSLRSNSDYDEYFRVDTAAIEYRSVYSDIMNIVTGYDRYGQMTKKDWCADIAIYVSGFENYAEGKFWNDSPDFFMQAGEHKLFIKDCKSDIQDMVQVYFELSDEQAAGLWDMTEEEIADLLYSKCQDLYPEGGSNE